MKGTELGDLHFLAYRKRWHERMLGTISLLPTPL